MDIGLQTSFGMVFFLLATPGFSSLCWHLKTIQYCREHGIRVVADGLTRELMHFPGHMDFFVAMMRKLYAAHGIRYVNPVREWPTPPDQQFLHRLVVDYHGFTNLTPVERTTGRYLHEIKIFPHPNVKGSDLDHSMQHDCYPFIVFNMFVFWIYLPFHSFEAYVERLTLLFAQKIEEISSELEAGTLP